MYKHSWRSAVHLDALLFLSFLARTLSEDICLRYDVALCVPADDQLSLLQVKKSVKPGTGSFDDQASSSLTFVGTVGKAKWYFWFSRVQSMVSQEEKRESPRGNGDNIAALVKGMGKHWKWQHVGHTVWLPQEWMNFRNLPWQNIVSQAQANANKWADVATQTTDSANTRWSNDVNKAVGNANGKWQTDTNQAVQKSDTNWQQKANQATKRNGQKDITSAEKNANNWAQNMKKWAGSPLQVQPIQGQPIQVQPIQVQPSQVQPSQVQPIQVQPQPIQAQPIQTAQKGHTFSQWRVAAVLPVDPTGSLDLNPSREDVAKVEAAMSKAKSEADAFESEKFKKEPKNP